MKTKKKSKRKSHNKSKIKDPPFSKKINKGSDATEGLIYYHYQDYTNITDYIVYLQSKSRFKNRICLFKDPIDCTLVLDQKDFKKGIQVKHLTFNNYTQQINECIKENNKRYIPIILETIKDKENHANVIVIDIKKKRIELFEPHGNRGDNSTLHAVKRTYLKKKEKVKEFFKLILSEYKFVNAVDTIGKYTLQSKYDANSGYCITWSLLYCHYRFLNPNISYIKITQHMNRKINLNKLLKYAKHVEEILKSI
jgi:hypothetical protein